MGRLFYVQLSGDERLDPPSPEQHHATREGEASQFTWSEHERPFSLESDLREYMLVKKF